MLTASLSDTLQYTAVATPLFSNVESAFFWVAMYSGGRDREEGGGSPAKRSHIDKGERERGFNAKGHGCM